MRLRKKKYQVPNYSKPDRDKTMEGVLVLIFIFLLGVIGAIGAGLHKNYEAYKKLKNKEQELLRSFSRSHKKETDCETREYRVGMPTKHRWQ